MATTNKKGSESKKTKLRLGLVRTSPTEQAQTIARLGRELEARDRELAESLQRENVSKAELREALEYQTATSEVLGIISRSPTDVQPVLDAIVESAARICEIDDVTLRLREGNVMAVRAHFGPIVIARLEHSIDEPYYQWIREHGTPYARAVENDFPGLGSAAGFRTFLGAPLRQHGELIGALNARRLEVRPFTPAQIKLLETF